MALFKRACPDQALALPVRPLGVLFGNRRDARHAAMAPFPTEPPQEPPLQHLGVEPVGFCPAMFPRYCDTRGMDHVRLDPTRTQPTRLAHLDDANDRAILVQGDEGSAQVVGLGHQGTPSVRYSDDGAISSPPAPYHLPAGGKRIRTLGPAG